MKAIRWTFPLGLLLATVAQAGRAVVAEPSPAPVAAGKGYHCAVLPDGKVGCWGEPGVPLDGDPRQGPPAIVPGVEGAVRVVAGPNHACALTKDGAATCWGDNASGQLGGPGSGPVAVPLEGIVDIDTGAAHTCALTADGRAWCWGENGNGQLGTASWEDTAAPVRVPGLSKVSAISTGRDFTCAIRDGDVWCWGADITGRGGPGAIRTEPAPVGVAGAVSLDAGFGHACAVREVGGLSCWGRLGPGGRARGPEAMDLSAKQVTAGFAHTCALAPDGVVRCWGSGEFGLLGNGACGDADRPVRVAALEGVSAIDAGWTHTCATTGDDVWCWGGNWTGEIPLQGKTPPCEASFAEPQRMPTEQAAAVGG